MSTTTRVKVGVAILWDQQDIVYDSDLSYSSHCLSLVTLSSKKDRNEDAHYPFASQRG